MGTVKTARHTVIAVKCHKDSETTHSLWLQKDYTFSPSILKTAKNQNCTLLVKGIPVYATDTSIRNLFSCCGLISSVTLSNPGQEILSDHLQIHVPKQGFQEARVVFQKSQSVSHALNLKYEGDYCFSTEANPLPTMYSVWQNELSAKYSVDTDKLMKDCTEYMEQYDKSVEQEEQRNRKLAAKPDDDGWTTVVRTTYKKPGKQMKSFELERYQKKKKKQELLHFYKQQVGNNKAQKIQELKKKFEQDKKKIQEMRRNRKFKPI